MNPECDEGNIEYKLKITPVTEKRKEELITQMSFRLNEGCGECIYILGVGDNGELNGITEYDYKLSMSFLNHMVKQK